MSILIIWIFICIAAYLTGSIPFGYILGKAMHRNDIRAGGSGSTGATNALRQYGVKTGLLVLLFDLLKGFAVAWLALHSLPGRIADSFGYSPLGALLATLPLLLVIVGHMYPVWLKGQGGKGVATAAGVFLAYAPVPLLIAVAVFVAVTALSRYVSLGSMVAVVVLVIANFLWDRLALGMPAFPWFTLIVALLIIYKHNANILRLLEGTENKLSFKKQGTA